jgi:hypothetical protein
MLEKEPTIFDPGIVEIAKRPYCHDTHNFVTFDGDTCTYPLEKCRGGVLSKRLF